VNFSDYCRLGMVLCIDMAVEADRVRADVKQTAAKSVLKQGRNADHEPQSFISIGADRPGGIAPEMANKSSEGVGVLRRMERAAVAPVNSSLKLDRRNHQFVATANASESHGKLNREKLLVNVSVAQAAHG